MTVSIADVSSDCDLLVIYQVAVIYFWCIKWLNLIARVSSDGNLLLTYQVAVTYCWRIK